jgi:RecB family exonuclease
MDVIEPLLAKLPDDEAAVQRTRLLGSAADEGLAEAVFQLEAEWETPVRERLLEQSLDGEFDIQTETGTRRIALRGKADRIDLLEDRTFRIIDYKLSRAPDRKQALQLPVYTVCTIQHLRRTRAEDWSQVRPATSRSVRIGNSCRCWHGARRRTRPSSTHRCVWSTRSIASSAANFRQRLQTR